MAGHDLSTRDGRVLDFYDFGRAWTDIGDLVHGMDDVLARARRNRALSQSRAIRTRPGRDDPADGRPAGLSSGSSG